jgi:hypothetical protein
MKHLKYLPFVLCVVFIACLHIASSAQTAEEKKIAAINASGSSVRWDVAAPNAGITLIISAPDGRVFSKSFKGGSTPNFSITDAQGEKLPDGQYTYELRLTPASLARNAATSNGRGKDDEPEAVRAARKSAMPSQPVVESGSFSIVNGAVVTAGASEESSSKSPNKVSQEYKAPYDVSTKRSNFRLHHVSTPFMPDQVIPDDLIVQGSTCVGLDCVNNENFGFDTIRLKENNDRIQFDDTSTSTGFPTNNWQIRANSSASGGASFLGFVDQGTNGNSESGTVVFEVDAGAPANALRVSNIGKVGLRTATPVLDLHITTSDTPAHRLEQTNAGGFTAQTWDIAGNEANFFVRDVTGGSRLPFRIRPGAPTSSVDVAASGNVGVGTASPGFHLHVQGSGIQTIAVESTQNGNNAQFAFIGKTAGGTAQQWLLGENLATTVGAFEIFDNTAAQNRFFINTAGNVGIGTTSPDQKLSVNGDASKTGGGSWQTFSDERLKNIKGNFTSGLKAVLQLQPLRYEYKPDNVLGLKSERQHIGFSAQALQKVIPEAVAANASGYMMVNNDPILWTMLNAIKEQQKEIEQLKGQIRQLRNASRRQR